MSGKRVMVLMALLISMAGCSTVEKQAFNKEGALNFKTVMVTERTGDETYDIAILAHPGGNFGLIGGLIAAADMQSKSTRLTAALDPKSTLLQHRFASKLAESLAKEGYQTTITPVSKTIEDKLVFDSLRSKVTADALLTISIHGQYIAGGPSTDYFPNVVVKVICNDQKTGKKLYQDTITYGYNFPKTQAVHLPGDPGIRFKDMDALVADPQHTRDALYAGVDAIVAQITTDLKQ